MRGYIIPSFHHHHRIRSNFYTTGNTIDFDNDLLQPKTAFTIIDILGIQGWDIEANRPSKRLLLYWKRIALLHYLVDPDAIGEPDTTFGTWFDYMKEAADEHHCLMLHLEVITNAFLGTWQIFTASALAIMHLRAFPNTNPWPMSRRNSVVVAIKAWNSQSM